MAILGGENGHFGVKEGPKSQIWDFFSVEKKFRHFFKTKKLVSMAKISNIKCTDLEK